MARDPVRQLLVAYPVLHHALKQRAVGDGTGGQISAHQATVLSQLDRAEPSTLSELASVMGVALPTMSLLVDRLTKAGLIRRDRDGDDGRRVALRLTTAGERAARASSLLDPERVRQLLASLSQPDRAASVAAVLTLAQAARRLAPADRSRSPRRGKGSP